MPTVLTRITLTLYGQLASLKNSRQMVYVGGKPRLIPKKEAVQWEKDAIAQIPVDHRVGLEGPIRLTCEVYYASRRPDLDIALLMDTLQHAEVIKNDRQIQEIHATKKLDADNPRVELLLEELDAL
jgi:Holliday junction resolvase RusA-like endonuclease